jgi:hypothetical protein
MDTLDVECSDPELRARIRSTVRRAHAACFPITKINSAPIRDEEEKKVAAITTTTPKA